MPVNSFNDYPMTWKPDRQTLKRPIYLSLASQLEQDIRLGLLPPGTKLPPQRELADFLDINFTTITRAYKICELKGLLHARTGSGTFVTPQAAQTVTISLAGMQQECIDLGLVASYEETNTLTLPILRQVARSQRLESLLTYACPDGMPAHKQAGIYWLQHLGLHTDPEHIALVSGTQNGLVICLSALFSPGDRIAVDRYTYANLIELAKLYHLQLIPIDGDAQGMSAASLAAHCQLHPIQGIYLMPSCSNPTTIRISTARREELAEVIRRYRLIFLEDDIHAFLTADILPDYQGPMVNLVPEQGIYICGTSKSICSGLRVAYLAGGETFREPLLKALFNINVKTSALDSEVITQLIRSGQIWKIIARKFSLAQAANDCFNAIFPQAVQGHPLSFFRWLPIACQQPGIIVEQQLLTKGIRVYHSDRFLCGNAAPQKYLRISLATTADLAELKKGLGILADYIASE